MIVYLNGQFLPEEQARVSVLDRGFLYGDGLFETVRVSHSRPFRWKEHLRRFLAGAACLHIAPPLSPEALLAAAQEVVAKNQAPEALLRLHLSRGRGRRGYSPEGAASPTLLITVHPVNHPAPPTPEGWRLITSSIRLAGSPLQSFKHCNKLPQILARAEAEAAGADEALLLDEAGHALEAASSNLFWLNNGSLHTPPANTGILPGITRQVVIELAGNLGIDRQESFITPVELLRTQGAFLSVSSAGIIRLDSLDGQPLPHSPLVERLYTAYQELLQLETRS